MSIDVLSQLQAVDTELSAQEEQLTSQLETLREKLKGIQTVIAMYGTPGEISSEPATEVPAKQQEKPAKAAKPKAKKTTSKKTTGKKTVKKASTTSTNKKTAKKVSATSTRKKTAKKVSATSTRKKKDGRAATWQKYTRPGVKNESIPDAVRLILETQPTKDFKIAEVMDALFKEGMPKSQYLKARNRISNVLSGGVRAGDWYKGERGSYRMTAA